MVSGDLENPVGVVKPNGEKEFIFSKVPSPIVDFDEQWFSAAGSKAVDIANDLPKIDSEVGYGSLAFN